MENLVIIGAGPAGYTAGVYTARANLNPLLIEGLQPGGQLVTTGDVENYPGFPESISGSALVDNMRRQVERFGTRIRTGEVTSVNFQSRPFTLVVDNETTLEARCVIIASGASAIYLGLESEQRLIGRGVSACATCDGALYRNVPVAVVGGGDTAMEEALFLTRFASRVTIIHRRDQFRASKIMSDRVKQHPKIQIMWDSVIEEVMDVPRQEVTGIRLKNVKSGRITNLPISGLFIAVGHRPNTAPFVGQIAMDDTGYIVTRNTRTNIEGVFAAGDVQDHVYRQAVTAAGSGCMAAIEAERFLKP